MRWVGKKLFATEVVLFGKLGENEVDGFIDPIWENKKSCEHLNLFPKKRNNQNLLKAPRVTCVSRVLLGERQKTKS
ncbi:MAG: hypothetical protein LBJ67_07230 [Planctomycetaceae bacterium]|jgi:hypothetical protein|nr:hypothetical protein [Planctomycetaceae bacterium]